MSKRKNKKQMGQLYFKQSDWMRPVGGILCVASIIWYWLGFSMASYYGPIIMLPIGLILLILGGVMHVSDADVNGEVEHLLQDYDASVTNMPDFDRKVLKQPSDVVTDAYDMGQASLYRRNKGSSIISNLFVRSHFFFTKDALLVCARRVSLIDMDLEDGKGAEDIGGTFAFEDITACRLEESEVSVPMANTKKSATARRCELVLLGGEQELLRLPVHNDMDVSTLCDEVNRRIGAKR